MKIKYRVFIPGVGFVPIRGVHSTQEDATDAYLQQAGRTVLPSAAFVIADVVRR